MQGQNTGTPMIAKIQLPSPSSTCSSDSETGLSAELEQKRRQLDQEIATFRVQKDKEFRHFEQELRTSRRRMEDKSGSGRRSHADRDSSYSLKPKRASSSSALDLLQGHGLSKHCQLDGATGKNNAISAAGKRASLRTKTSPSPGKPTLSVDSTNISGETAQKPPALSPSRSAMTSRTMTRSSSTSSTSSTSSSSSVPTSSPKMRCVTAPSRPNLPPTPTRDCHESVSCVVAPVYLPLLDVRNNSQFPSPSPLVTPPAEEHEDQSHHHLGTMHLPAGILPLQSSSFPPVVTKFSPSNPSAKRAYTAPATSSGTRKPSALRSSSGGTLIRRRKHVTFRLADSAIVEPSSSYEEGSSPHFEAGGQTKSAPPVSPSGRGTRSPLRFSNTGGRNCLIGDHTRSDEEDAAAGVVPGMNMGEVMQKLNDFSMANGDDVDPISFDDDDEEDVAWMDTRYHEHESGSEDGSDEASEEAEPDSYFSPRSPGSISMPTNPSWHDQTRARDRSGSSPVAPSRDQEWENLSSSDKDRLLFRRDTSDDEAEETDDSRKGGRTGLQRGLSALSKTSSHGSLTSLANLANQKPRSRVTPPNKVAVPVKSLIGGSSGVGFFELDEELDEELVSPGARDMSTSGTLDLDDFDSDAVRRQSRLSEIDEDEEEEDDGIGISISRAAADSIKAGFVAASSMPIDIVRPSISVSSSWRGTFGH